MKISDKSPDFAFPETVRKESNENLEQALKKHDENKIMRSMINIQIADCLIDNDNIDSTIALIDSLTIKLTEPTYKALASLLKATILAEVYSSMRYKADERSIPLLPYPEKISLWSGAQFRSEINALISEALTYTELFNNPISNFKDLIIIPEESTIFYPSLYDFIAVKSISILNRCSIGQIEIPDRYFVESYEFVKLPPLHSFSPEVSEIIEIYKQLLVHYADRPAPFINYDIERINFIEDHKSGNLYDRKIELLKELFKRTSGSEYSGLILKEIYELSNYQALISEDQLEEWLYKSIEENLSKFDSFAYNKSLRAIRHNMGRYCVNLTAPETLYPGRNEELNATIKNGSTANVYVYEVTKIAGVNSRNVKYEVLKNLKPLSIVQLKADSVPSGFPYKLDAKGKIKIKTPGLYVIVLEDEIKKARDNTFFSISRSTRLAVNTLNAGIPMVWVVDLLNGEPLNGVTLKKRKNDMTLSLAPTNADGFGTITKSDYNSQISAGKLSDQFANWVWIGDEFKKDDSEIVYGKCFTNRGIYRPGDTLELCLVLYVNKNEQSRLLSDKKIKVEFYNSNYQQIDTIIGQTDEFGRVVEEFNIPSDGLTGEYSLRCYEENNEEWEHINLSGNRFMVSDYKLPEFFVEVNAPQIIPESGDVIITGIASTYSGFPLSECKIRLSLSASPAFTWWRQDNPITFFTTDNTTDAAGKFNIEIEKSVLNSSPFPKGKFIAEIEIVSNTGEVQTAARSFFVESTYTIASKLNESYNLDTLDKKIEIFKVVDNTGKELSGKSIMIEISDSRGKAIFSHKVLAPVTAELFSNLSPGTYKITVSGDGFDKNESIEETVVLYSLLNSECPTKKLLWTPDKSIKYNGKTASVIISTDADTAKIMSALVTDNGCDIKWLTLERGIHSLEFVIPEDCDEGKLFLSCVNNLRSEKILFTLKRQDSNRRLRIKQETFRNHLIPGSSEMWRFKITATSEAKEEGIRAAAIATMFNKALNQLYHYSPTLSFVKSQRLYLDYSLVNFGSLQSNFCVNSQSYDYSINIPDWELYGQSLYTLHRVFRSYGAIKYRKVGKSTADSDYIEAESAVKECAVAYDAGAPLLNGVSVNTGSTSSAQTDGVTENSDEPTKNIYRDKEVAQAFFKPQLVTDSDGSLNIQFTVPDANASWNFILNAYTSELLCEVFNETAIGCKPIMVSANLPRFMRVGDRAELRAVVMNASDAKMVASTTIELFDPISNEVFSQHIFENEIGSSESATLSVMFEAPEITAIGFRVKSFGDNFVDGEQVIIPVLPASNLVIESIPFYFLPDSDSLNITLPSIPEEAKVNLRFCENPIWYIVSSLPGLTTADISTPYEAARAIYTASIASKLLKEYPQIKEAIKYWSTSDKTSDTLSSMLEKNEDLKQFVLSSTPWVQDAQNATERMTRLSMLLNPKNIENVVNTSIEKLSKLQTADGGWKWIERMDEASLWATESALSLFGYLVKTDCLPSCTILTDMIQKALTYCDSREYDIYRKSNNPNISYAYMRSEFSLWNKPSDKIEQMILASSKKAVADWKTYTLFEKGISSMLLYRTGFKNVAREIMSSVSEFSKTNPTKGMWWPSLDNNWFSAYNNIGITAMLFEAYKTIGAPKSEIDQIAQWLILRKEAQEWSDTPSTVTAIYDILSSSNQWISYETSADIRVDNHKLYPSKIERFTGEMSMDISSMRCSEAQLEISRKSNTPAWGSVSYFYPSPINDIKAVGCGDDLSIEKIMYRAVHTPDGIEWKEIDSLKVGDRVKIDLVLEFGRNMDYVTIIDNRAACLEPTDQLPAPIWLDGICFYRENRNTTTNIFISNVFKGSYRISYEMTVNNAGMFASGIATVQSQYAPQFTAHSSGTLLNIQP